MKTPNRSSGAHENNSIQEVSWAPGLLSSYDPPDLLVSCGEAVSHRPQDRGFSLGFRVVSEVRPTSR